MIMQTLARHIARFQKSRRGAVAVIFALSLLPLVLMVGLAIDFSFFAEARSQIQLAADAAATHAIRAAAGTYALETNSTNPTYTVTQATADAVAAGQTAGDNWFTAQVGALPTAYIPGAGGNNNPDVTVTPTTSPAGFTASVVYTGNYPPFFDRLFKSSAIWAVSGTSKAAAQYSYVEIMMMLDTSQSMLIGSNAADINTLSYNTACTSPTYVTISSQSSAVPFSGTSPLFESPHPPNGAVTDTYEYDTTGVDNDQVNFQNLVNYTPNNGTNDAEGGSCKTGYIQTNLYNYPTEQATYNNTGYVAAPCAFACHDVSTTVTRGTTKYSMDFYGLARYLYDSQGRTSTSVQLRLDKVLQATEQVLTSMIANEQASNQYSVGLYQFNNDVSVLASGTQGTSSDPSYEATSNLSTVLSAVYGIDYTHAVETTFPPVNAIDDGNTNFATSMNDLFNGNATEGGSGTATKLGAGGNGNTQTTPIKDLFIVTDGMEDQCCSTARVMGEMTSYASETGALSSSAVCGQFKNRGFNVYVLYINYNPVPTLSYYTYYYGSPPDAFMSADYPLVIDPSEHTETVPVSQTGLTALNATYPADSPNMEALRACSGPATTNTSPASTYFYTATDGPTIAKQLSLILQSAIGTSIRVTQ
jgi:Flp pilus assembly protein TadG